MQVWKLVYSHNEYTSYEIKIFAADIHSALAGGQRTLSDYTKEPQTYACTSATLVCTVNGVGP